MRFIGSIMFLVGLFTILFTGIYSTPVSPRRQQENYAVPYPASGHAYPPTQPYYSQPQQAQPGYPQVAYPAPAYHPSNPYPAPAYHQTNPYTQPTYNGYIHQQPQPYHTHPTGAPVLMPTDHPGGFQAASQAHKLGTSAAADFSSVLGPKVGKVAYDTTQGIHRLSYRASNAVASTIQHAIGKKPSSSQTHYHQVRSPNGH